MGTDSRIPVARGTRKKLKRQKRGGESYDQLLRKMIEQYDPEQALRSESSIEGPVDFKKLEGGR